MSINDQGGPGITAIVSKYSTVGFWVKTVDIEGASEAFHFFANVVVCEKMFVPAETFAGLRIGVPNLVNKQLMLFKLKTEEESEVFIKNYSEFLEKQFKINQK